MMMVVVGKVPAAVAAVSVHVRRGPAMYGGGWYRRIPVRRRGGRERHRRGSLETTTTKVRAFTGGSHGRCHGTEKEKDHKWEERHIVVAVVPSAIHWIAERRTTPFPKMRSHSTVLFHTRVVLLLRFLLILLRKQQQPCGTFSSKNAKPCFFWIL